MAGTTLLERAVVRLSGEDVRGFLQGLVTQDIDRVQDGAPQWSGLLTAQGKALFDFLLWADKDDMLIDCEADAAADLIKRLSLYRLRRPIEIALDDGLHVHWSPDAVDQPADPRIAALGHRWLSAQKDEPGDDRWLAHRLSLGVPEGRAELGDDKTLWLEANAEELDGVDFDKGCYIGQENTARMHYRNKVNRRLVVVPLAQADESRQRRAYPALGLSLEHRRTSDLEGLSLPEWLNA
jgi:folate-binding protein YgfZ